MKKLGVNVDHVATLRNARQGTHPDPIEIARLCVHAGVDNITFHLREDRRHIRDEDVLALNKEIQTDVNFEMACTPEMVNIAKSIRPKVVTLVPEKREELTTEGGLNLSYQQDELVQATQSLQQNGIEVSYFIEPEIATITRAKEMGVNGVELHTGHYAQAFDKHEHHGHLLGIQTASKHAFEIGLQVHAGHGLNQDNLVPLVQNKYIESFQIGHALIGDALIGGIEQTVLTYKKIISE